MGKVLHKNTPDRVEWYVNFFAQPYLFPRVGNMVLTLMSLPNAEIADPIGMKAPD
jgi:hypothetical protein